MTIVTLMSCSDELTDSIISPSNAPIPISVSGSIVQQNITRANEQGFVTGDRMGIYVVDYEDGQPGDLSASGIRAQNVLYTFDGDSYTWSSPTTIYWRDKQTPVSIYGYYPGQNYLSNPTAWQFSVQTDQSTPSGNGSLSGYEQSDLLWGKEGRVAYTEDQVILKYNHILAHYALFGFAKGIVAYFTMTFEPLMMKAPFKPFRLVVCWRTSLPSSE